MIVQSKLFNRDLLIKLFKFLFVGGVCTGLNYLIFYILFEYIHINYMVSSATGYLIGLAVGYYFNKFWTFSVQKIENDSNEYFIHKYLIIYLVSLGISTLSLFVFVDIFHINPVIANMISIGISTATNFVGTTFFVFNK